MFLSQGLLRSLRIYISLKHDELSVHVLIRHAVYSKLSEYTTTNRRGEREGKEKEGEEKEEEEEKMMKKATKGRRRGMEGGELRRWERKPMLLPESGHDRGPWTCTERRIK